MTSAITYDQGITDYWVVYLETNFFQQDRLLFSHSKKKKRREKNIISQHVGILGGKKVLTSWIQTFKIQRCVIFHPFQESLRVNFSSEQDWPLKEKIMKDERVSAGAMLPAVWWRKRTVKIIWEMQSWLE